MVFSSSLFLFLFLPLVLAGYFAMPGMRSKNFLLLIASLAFYSWGEAGYVVVLLVSITANWIIGRLLTKAVNPKGMLTIGVGINLLILGYYKYANFVVENINHLFARVDFPQLNHDPVHLPIGISFFTFQAISYLVDIYRGEATAQRNYFRVALYISLFPQLIAGPIVRYGYIQEQLEKRVVGIEDVAAGTQRFIIGLAKKVLIANVLGETADEIFTHDPQRLDPATAWLGIVCYSLQIYFDFSGYSDMAIGLGRMFGFRFPENFNYPYISQSVQEFWRRWHISLSTWFRDYLYIPLGGNQNGGFRTYVNLLIVFFLCGLWHGASWTFVAWGLFHGIFLVLERLGLRYVIQSLPRVLRHFYLLFVVLHSWVLFRSESIAYAFDYFRAMYNFAYVANAMNLFDYYVDREVTAILIVGLIGSSPLLSLWNKSSPIYIGSMSTALNVVVRLVTISVLILSLMSIAADTYNPFIYFRF